MRGPRFAGVLLFLIDVAGLFGAFSIAYNFRFQRWYDPLAGELWLLIVAAMTCLYFMDSYNIRVSRTTNRFLADSIAAITGAIVSTILVVYIAGIEQFTALFGRGVLPVAVVFFALWTIVLRWAISEWIHITRGITNWLVIADESVYSEFEADSKSSTVKVQSLRLALESNASDLEKWSVADPAQSAVIFQDGIQKNAELVDKLKNIGQSGVHIFSLTEYYEKYWERLSTSNMDRSWVFRSTSSSFLNDRIGIRLKRLADFVIGATGLVITSPILVFTALLVKFTSPGNVIYKQTRVGLNRQNFTLYKFRSMVSDAEKQGPQWSAVDDVRVTKVGRFIRATRLDELPQLWNLVLGNMSLIGPRPERPEFVEQLKLQIPFYELRLTVTPGLTGWAQVNYPYGASIEDARKKLEYDLFYIKHHSIRLDLSIVLRTVAVVLRAAGR